MSAYPRRIRKLCIANRGEIAVRIARAADELGVVPVAVASEADAHSLHARSAAEVVLIGPGPARESYLDGAKVIRAALERRCDAVHPGYGFLAQSERFAAEVLRAGLIWVGPPPEAIRLMGDKTAARRSMQAAGVPVVPGFESLEPLSDERLLEEAGRIGLPLMVKAAAGGGGRGMRVVREAGELREALTSARREAEKAFGDGRLFLERYVEGARHVELQVLCDAHGGAIHLLERECSLQRRHQKVIEESPSPLLDDDLRARMGEAALAAARASGYVNAGTVEFLLGEDRSFYFLEMNTRIQVEHPVTEMVTGIDIVKAQLRVAEGERLRWRQEEVRARGHAIECRVNAEDPAQGFLPSHGRIALARWPEGPGVRVDRGYDAGDEVPLHYDSLIAKVITHAEDRAQAIARMERALARTAVLGVETNLRFLEDLLAHPVFREGRASTTFIERELAGWRPREASAAETEDALTVLALAEALASAAPLATSGGAALGAGQRGGRAGASGAGAGGAGGEPHSPWGRADGFRPGHPRS
jgi:acetyl-CoA carboxylase biotin carboxylase subunit